MKNVVKKVQTERFVSAYVGPISAVRTLKQTQEKSKLYTTCLGG